jgi:hypothetical protein
MIRKYLDFLKHDFVNVKTGATTLNQSVQGGKPPSYTLAAWMGIETSRPGTSAALPDLQVAESNPLGCTCSSHAEKNNILSECYAYKRLTRRYIREEAFLMFVAEPLLNVRY